MFDPTAGNHPFLGPSFRLTPTIPTRATPQSRPQLLARNENLNPGYKGGEPATPQPVAKNVAPQGMEKTVRALKKEPGVDNPFALAWWIKKHQ